LSKFEIIDQNLTVRLKLHLALIAPVRLIKIQEQKLAIQPNSKQPPSSEHNQ
jgi:hypothetical protein